MGNQHSCRNCCEGLKNNLTRDQMLIGQQNVKYNPKSTATRNEELEEKKEIKSQIQENKNKQNLAENKPDEDIRKTIKRKLQLQPFVIHQQERKIEIYLNIDQRWCSRMLNSEQNPLQLAKIYKLMSTQVIMQGEAQRNIYQRSTLDNKKVQLIFKHNIPTIGKYYFQLELISIIPSKKCQFTVGVVDYERAIDKVHCRDGPYQQSYTVRQRYPNIQKEKENVPMILNLRIKVQISRQDKSCIAFYINDQLKKSQPLRKQLDQNAISLVPYIQTQYQAQFLRLRFLFKNVIVYIKCLLFGSSRALLVQSQYDGK